MRVDVEATAGGAKSTRTCAQRRRAHERPSREKKRHADGDGVDESTSSSSVAVSEIAVEPSREMRGRARCCRSTSQSVTKHNYHFHFHTSSFPATISFEMAERQRRREQIRPRFVDLAEFGGDDELRDPSEFDWPPAATVVRRPPPSIGTKGKASSAQGKGEDGANRASTSALEENPSPASESKPAVAKEKESSALKPQASHPPAERAAKSKRVTISATPSVREIEAVPRERPLPFGSGATASKPLSRFAQQRADAAAAAAIPRSASKSSDTGFSFGPSSNPARASTSRTTESPQRFPLDFGGEHGAQGGIEEGGEDSWQPPAPPPGEPLVGSVFERKSGGNASASGSEPASSKVGSRFAQTRRAAKEPDGITAGASTSNLQASPQKALHGEDTGVSTSQGWGGFPSVSRWSGSSSIPAASRRELPETESVAMSDSSRPGNGEDADVQWLDEDGQPMSAFRRSRLQRAGLGPPARKAAAPAAPASLASKGAAGPSAEPTRFGRDPGGGADISEISKLLSDVGAENDRMLQGMSKQELEEEQRSLETLFSPQVLEMFRSRGAKKVDPGVVPDSRLAQGQGAGSKGRQTSSVAREEALKDAEAAKLVDKTTKALPAARESSGAAASSLASTNEGRSVKEAEGTPGDIRKRFFPDASPPEANPSLAWMLPSSGDITNASAVQMASAGTVSSSAHAAFALRFDFHGQPILPRRLDVQPSTGAGEADPATDTYLAGLHHHGVSPEAPGYATDELLHLAQSTVASQRALALQVLARMLSRFPAAPFAVETPQLTGAESGTNLTTDVEIARQLHAAGVRERATLMSRWLLEDRHESVRYAALECLRAALLSTASGSAPVHGVESDLGSNKPPHAGKKGSFEALFRADLVHGLLETQLLQVLRTRFLEPLARDSDRESTGTLPLLLDALCAIARRDQKAGEMVAQSPGLIDALLRAAIKKQWPTNDTSAPSLGLDATQNVSRLPTSAQPLLNKAARPSPAPEPRAIELLLILVLSSRRSATALITSGAIDTLLRFLAIGPWTLRPEDKQRGFALLERTLDVYIALAQYGLYATLVGRAWTLWQSLGAWCVRFVEALAEETDGQSSTSERSEPRFDEESIRKLRGVQRFLRLLNLWTLCATDPHATPNPHDVTWSQVSEWFELGLRICVKVHVSSKSSSSLKLAAALAAGAAWDYLATWCDGAKVNQPERYQAGMCEIASALQGNFFTDEAVQCLALTIAKSATRPQPQTSEAIWERQASFEKLSSACNAAHVLLRLRKVLGVSAPDKLSTAAVTLRSTSLSLLDSDVWEEMDGAASRAIGAHGLLRHLTAFCALAQQTAEDSACGDTAHRGAASQVRVALALLAVLRPGDEAIALELVRTLLDGAEQSNMQNVEAKILWPFLLENVSVPAQRLEGTPLYPPLRPVPADLARVSSLLYSDKPQQASNVDQRGEEEDDEDDDPSTTEVDPLTGTPFWRCPASGLPLRRDWPLMALDDLLHSADTAVFNRPDNLPADWDASELDVVRATLTFTVSLLNAVLNKEGEAASVTGDAARQSLALPVSLQRALPAPSEILFAIMRVFMLEQGQAEEASGAATGKDIFRDPQVASLLARLFALSNTLAEHVSQEDSQNSSNSRPKTLEDAAAATLGVGVPFYQFFTDLVGLYDSISFGDPLFARALLPPLSMAYQPDYRRLLWNDYAQALRTIRVPLDAAPFEDEQGLQAYLWPIETDQTILVKYLDALASGSVRKETHSFLYKVALHHLAVTVWKGKDVGVSGSASTVGTRQLAKAIFAPSVAEELKKDVLRYPVHPDEASLAAPIRERLDWLSGVVHSSIVESLKSEVEGSV